MNARHKAALIFAGYHWIESGHGLPVCSYLDGDGIYFGAVSSLIADGGPGWMVEIHGRFEVCIRRMGQTRYPTQKAAMRALEEIAGALLAAGLYLHTERAAPLALRATLGVSSARCE